MLQNAIKLFSLLLLLTVAAPVLAQDITSVRDIHTLTSEQITFLETGAENLSTGDVAANVFNDLVTGGQTITIVVVLLSDPRNSGLANLNSENQPSRIHVFARDTSAVTQGFEGMGIQIVDGEYETSNLLNFGVGEVVKITGAISTFSTASQFSPETIELLGSYSDLGLPDSILDPVIITTDQLNSAVGPDDGVQTNWANLPDYRHQYVRLEGATLQARVLDPDRPDFYVSSDGGTTVLNFYDTGLQFRNDRGSYPSTFNNEDLTELDDFVPPPPGSVVNLQGFLLFQAFADGIGRGVPDHALMSIAPYERRGCEGDPLFRCDLEVTESPPIISGVQGPTSVPDGSAAVTLSFSAEADPNRTIDSGFCAYYTSADATELEVSASLNGDVYECMIPAQADGVYTLYQTGATDNTGASLRSEEGVYRTLVDGIDSIEDIQLTMDEGPGASPFSGFDATAMNFTATVQSDPATSGLIVLQDNADLDPWSGLILFESSTSLQRGDIITVTEADISEFRDVTQISNATYTVDSSGNDMLGYKVLTTDVLLDESIAEGHEAMMLQFDNVTITTRNADSPGDPTGNNFGEWAISSDGTVESQLRVDDGSDAIPGDPGAFDGVPEGYNYEAINRWATYSFHRGILSYSFGNWKLIPESPADLGEVVNVANEDDGLPHQFTLTQNFPNPFNPTTSIAFSVPATDHVSLEVFDILGRSVSTLVNGVLSSGEYTIQFDAANLPSGMYLYRLSAGDKVSTKKMLLMK